MFTNSYSRSPAGRKSKSGNSLAGALPSLALWGASFVSLQGALGQDVRLPELPATSPASRPSTVPSALPVTRPTTAPATAPASKELKEREKKEIINVLNGFASILEHAAGNNLSDIQTKEAERNLKQWCDTLPDFLRLKKDFVPANELDLITKDLERLRTFLDSKPPFQRLSESARKKAQKRFSDLLLGHLKTVKDFIDPPPPPPPPATVPTSTMPATLPATAPASQPASRPATGSSTRPAPQLPKGVSQLAEGVFLVEPEYAQNAAGLGIPVELSENGKTKSLLIIKEEEK